MPSAPRILVVEDDGFTRMLLANQLRDLEYDVVGAAPSCAEGMASAKVNRPDLLIADLDLGPGPTGVDLAYAVRKALPHCGILMLSTYVDTRLIGDFRPLPSGSVFMVKRSLTDIATLASAICVALDRGAVTALNPTAGPPSLPRLRDGQIEIMRLVACGYTNAEIAKQRVLEEPSVAKAIARLLHQLGLVVTPDRNPRVLITQAYFTYISGSPGAPGI